MKAKSKALKSYKLDIYRLALFCKKENVKHNLSKVLMFQCIDNIITFYCMTPVNLYFQLVKVADIVIPKKQKEASEALVDILAPTIISFKMEPGPVNGFYIVYMDENKTAEFHAVRQQDNDEDFDDEDFDDGGFDDEDFDDEPFYGSPIDQSQISQEQQQSQQKHEQLLQQKQQQEQQEKPQTLLFNIQNDKGKQPMRGSSIQPSNQLVRENVELTFSAEGSLPFVSPNVSTSVSLSTSLSSFVLHKQSELSKPDSPAVGTLKRVHRDHEAGVKKTKPQQESSIGVSASNSALLNWLKKKK